MKLDSFVLSRDISMFYKATTKQEFEVCLFSDYQSSTQAYLEQCCTTHLVKTLLPFAVLGRALIIILEYTIPVLSGVGVGGKCATFYWITYPPK